MRIAIGVHGRFHAFELARSLLALQGSGTKLFTNYPKRIVGHWDVPHSAVETYRTHYLLTRLVSLRPSESAERLLHENFGKWLGRRLDGTSFDVLHCWSGVAEESFIAHKDELALLVMRGSSHIRVQRQLLEEESERTGLSLETPSDWRVAREEREYELADAVVVLSSFASGSFQQQGITRERIHELRLGARTKRFRATPEALDERIKRITSGQTLRVLFVGSPSLRKGLWDLGDVARRLAGQGFEFRCVGPPARDSKPLLGQLKHFIDFVPKQAERELPQQYAWGDVFIFPTIEDGFAVVLMQAHAAGLPILATTNCSAPDFVQEGRTGWILPIRSPEAFVNRLRWCQDNRPKLAEMVYGMRADTTTRDWDEVGRDFLSFCHEHV